MFSNPHTPNNCAAKDYLAFLVCLGLVLWTAGSSYAFESRGDSASSGYIYPMTLRYGVLNALSGVNRDDAQVAIEMNFDRLSHSLNPDFKVTLEFLPDTHTAASLIQKRQLHALSITGIEYIRLSHLASVTPLFVASKLSESPVEPYVLVTRKGISLLQLLAMGQRRLILESYRSWDIGRMWLETVLNDRDMPESSHFFTSIQVVTKPMRMVLPVFFGQAEACLVSESVFNTMVDLNPQIGQKLHVLLRSPGFVKNLICIADYLDPELVEDMKEALRTMHMTEDGRQLLMIFQLRRNFSFKPEHLIETESVYRKFKKLKIAQN